VNAVFKGKGGGRYGSQNGKKVDILAHQRKVIPGEL